MDKILRWGIYAVALVPLIIFKDFLSPFHFGKVILFRPWVEALVVLYVVLVMRDRSFLPKPTPLFWAVTIFTAVYGITTLTGVNPYQSFVGTLERMGGWFTLVHFWAFFVIAVSVLRTREEWITFFKISIAVSAISAIYGFLQKTDIKLIIGSGGRGRIFGTIGNAALYAGYALVHIYLAAYLFITTKTDSRFVWGAIATLNTIAVVMTVVRGSVLGLLVSLFLFVVISVFLRKQIGFSVKFRNYSLIVVGIMIALELVLIASHNMQFVKQSGMLTRLSDISLKTRLINTRFWAWRAGIDGWNDSAKTMLLGWGPENFNVPFSKHFNPKFYQGPGSETLFDRAHNMFVEVLVTMGILGFASYVGIFIAACLMLWRMYRKSGDGNLESKMAAVLFFCALIAYAIHNSFIFDTSANYVAFFILAGFIHFMGTGSANDNIKKSSPIKSNARWQIGTALAVGAALALFGDGMFRSGAQFFILLVTSVICIPVFSSILANERAVAYASKTRNFSKTLSATIGIMLAVVTVIVTYYSTVLPVRANYSSTRAIVASWSSDHATALAKFKEALNYDVGISYEIRHRYAQYVLENYGKFKKENGLDAGGILLNAIPIIQKNLSYRQDYLPYLYISRTYIILGKNDPNSPYNDLALENSLKELEIAPSFVRTYYEVSQAYLNKKDYSKAIEYFQRAANLNPEVGQSWWYLAVTQSEYGDTNEVAGNLQKAIANGYNYRNDVDLPRLINVFAKLKDIRTVVKFYEELIAIKPDNPQYHASLATAYAQIGRLEDAVREAKVAAKLDQSFEPEAKKFVESLGRTW